jgi:membrane protein
MQAILELFKQTFKEWSEDKAPRLAAALAYYTTFSLAPILVIALWIADFFYFDRGAGQALLLDQVHSLAGSQAQELVGEMLEASQLSGGNPLTIGIGVVALIFGATGVFIQLEEALNTVWEVAPKPNRGLLGAIKDRFLSFTMVLGIGFLLLVSLVLSALLTALANWTNGLFPGIEALMQVVNFLISFLVITVLFALIFKYVPDAEVRWQDVWLGAAVTALLFSIGKLVIGLYLGNASSVEQFGAAGSLVVILLWVYYSAQISFFGAEFTQVYAKKYGQGIVPTENAIPLTENDRLQQGIPRKEHLAAAAERDVPVAQEAGVQAMAKRPAIASPNSFEPNSAPLAPAEKSLRLFTSVVAILVTLVSGYLLRAGNKSKE